MSIPNTDTRSPAPYLDYVVLVAVWALVRLPALGAFDLVSHDGCYYIAQARALLSGNPGGGGAFPPGYPLLIAAAMTVVADGVRAAQGVSALSGMVATIALYTLARAYLPRVPSILCAVVFTATPAFVRASLTTMSESAYVAWLILAMAAYVRERRVPCGLLVGGAAITRPEALGIAIALFVVDGWRRRDWRSTLSLVLPFAAVYSVNAVVPAFGGAEVSIVPKSDQLGLGALGWRAAESGSGDGALTISSLFEHYVARLPVDVARLFRHTAGIGLLVAIVGALRRPVVALVALVPLAVNPLFTLRPETRFIVPFIPFVVLFAFLGAHTVTTRRWRWALVALLVASAAAGTFVNRAQFAAPAWEEAAPARAAALQLREHIFPGATIADRKPFLAFYLEARYVEIPATDYESALGELVERRIDYLGLMTGVTDFFRPALAPLLYDEATVVGEPRLRQIYADDDGISVFAIRAVDLATSATIAHEHAIVSPRWNRDGDVVFAAGTEQRLFTVSPGGGNAPLETGPTGLEGLQGIAVSPDGARVAFVSSKDGNPDVHLLDPETGTVTTLTRSGARDVDPAWDGEGTIVFASDRTGEFELYRISPYDPTAALERLNTTGRRPRVSPDGSKLAWARGGGGVGVREVKSGREWAAPSPRHLVSAPSWSHDSRYLAVAASDQGSPDVFVVDPESRRSLRLTKSADRVDTAPDWHPTTYRLLYASGSQRPDEIVVLDGLGPYLECFEAERPRVYSPARSTQRPRSH